MEKENAPPPDDDYASHLSFHLRRGTRAHRPEKVWDDMEFAEAIAKAVKTVGSRGNTRSNSDREADLVESAGKELGRWLRKGVVPARKWGESVEATLFCDDPRHQGYLNVLRRIRIEHHRKKGTQGYIANDVDRTRRDRITRQILEQPEPGWCLQPTGFGEGYTNPSFNRRLIVDPPKLPKHHGRNWQAWERWGKDLKNFVSAEEKPFSNDDKMRLSTDPAGDDVTRVVIQKTDYLSSLMTDQLAWKRVRSVNVSPDGMAEVIWDGPRAFIDEGLDRARLVSLERSGISNQLGASTLGFSRDGYLMIVHQDKHNHQSREMLAPSGSGSLDWRDVAASGAGDFLDLVRYGARRELEEESSLLDDETGRGHIASAVKLVAFSRMLHRAGKPEFYCVGLIGAAAEELYRRKPERYYVKNLKIISDVPAIDWTRQSPAREVHRVCTSLLEMKDQLISLSHPLEHALMLLKDACEPGPAADALNVWLSDALQQLA